MMKRLLLKESINLLSRRSLSVTSQSLSSSSLIAHHSGISSNSATTTTTHKSLLFSCNTQQPSSSLWWYSSSSNKKNNNDSIIKEHNVDEAIELQEFIKMQANPERINTTKPGEPKAMNRKERRSMQHKLNRSSNNLVVGGIVSPTLTVPSHIDPPPYIKGAPVVDHDWDEEIEIHSQESINSIRESCKIARDVLEYAGSLVRPGITTDEIDRLVHQEIINRGAYPSPLGYKGYPKSICTSINEVICHGIPDSRPLYDGDIVNIDITVYYKGYHGDTSATFKVGEVDSAADKLIQVTKQALEAGIKAVKPGKPFSDIGKAIQTLVHKHSYGIPIELAGHGIGKEFHTVPYVFHVVNNLPYVMQPGMIFTIEPIVAESTKPYIKFKEWDDKWTMSTVEGGWSAQFEHTILVTNTGAEILTK